MDPIASTPKPPYFAVIFSSLQTDSLDGYDETSERMETLARQQPGFLGVEAARQGLGITISYWRDLDAIKRWKADVEHQQAQQNGRNQWYSNYCVRIARVERDYRFDRL